MIRIWIGDCMRGLRLGIAIRFLDWDLTLGINDKDRESES